MWISYVLGQAVSFFFTLFRMIPLAWNNRVSRTRFPQEGDVVISLTSHGERLTRVHYTLESIVRGNIKAPVVLWLDRKDYDAEWPKTLRRLVGRDEAEDVLQRTFLDLWRHADRYDPAQSFSGWLFTIAHRRAVDHLRGRRPTENGPAPQPQG